MNHEHDQTPASRGRLLSFLGVGGSVSCYVAMFPAILLGIVGILGISRAATLNALTAYMGSFLFQLVLILSILFLISGVLKYGAQPVLLSLLGGLGVFASMNLYVSEWLFTLSFAFIALAYLFVFRKTKAPQFKFALVLLIMVVTLGAIDVARSARSAPTPHVPARTHQHNNRAMDMMKIK